MFQVFQAYPKFFYKFDYIRNSSDFITFRWNFDCKYSITKSQRRIRNPTCWNTGKITKGQGLRHLV